MTASVPVVWAVVFRSFQSVQL